MRLYCVTYTQRDDEIGEHDTVEYFRTKRDAMRAVRGLSTDHPRAQFDNISLECIELPLRKQEIIEALNLSNHGQSAQNATLLEYFDDIEVSDD